MTRTAAGLLMESTMKRILSFLAIALVSTGALAQSERSDRREERRDRREERVERRDNGRDWRNDRDRRPSFVIRFGAPGYFVRTLPTRTRYVIYGGRRCRITITRRVTYRGVIVTTERRKCPGRPDVIIRSR